MTTANRSTVVGVFERQNQAEEAIERLRSANFSADQLGFAGHEESQAGSDVGENMTKGAASGLVPGGILGGVIGAVATGLIPGVGPIIGAGILAGTVGGAAAGAATGGVLGALTGLGVSEDDAHYYEDEFKAGRTLVSVKANGRYDEASSLLREAGAYDVETRGMANRSSSEAGPSRSQSSERSDSSTMELREEQLRARTQQVQTGEARIGKDVVEERRTLEVPVERDEVVVERRPVEGRQTASGSVGSDQEIRVPVNEERVQVDKETVVREEVEVRKEPIKETERVEETVRREEPRIERSGS